MSGFRVEKDSMGEMQVPQDALYAAQTQRAVENFPVSHLRMPRGFIRALGLIKSTAAQVNQSLKLIDPDIAESIQKAGSEVESGKHDAQFVVDVFQTGSGTSTNMNTNEVIAHLASKQLGSKVHPNDHVNMGQSSNDVIPTAIHVSACLETHERLLPALQFLESTIKEKAKEVDSVVKNGRTHLMDAMPIRMSQELNGWARQIELAYERIQGALKHLSFLAQGGTAVGTGINAHPEFGEKFAKTLAASTGFGFQTSPNYFESLSTQDAAVELSGQLKTLAVSLTKIANDLRWMNSGPHSGLGEIALPALQPGSSIMPGKVNPVIPESVAMVCAQVIGNDVTITLGGQAGNFQLNVMLPVIAYNLLQSIDILANACSLLAKSAIAGFEVKSEKLLDLVERNPIMVTALNPLIGYELGAKIAKQAYADGRRVRDVASELCDLPADQLDKVLDPAKLTEGGIAE